MPHNPKPPYEYWTPEQAKAYADKVKADAEAAKPAPRKKPKK